MKKFQVATAMILIMFVLVVTGCGRESRASDGSPSNSGAAQAPTSARSTITLPGAMERLEAALGAKSSVEYRILTVDGAVADKDAYLDRLLASQQLPTKDMLVLVLFTKDNYDMRFAMGSSFLERKVSIDEMLSLVRTYYLSKAREGDPASGLAGLIDAINKRME